MPKAKKYLPGPRDLFRAVDAGRILPIYLFIGQEWYLIEMAIEKLKGSFLGNDEKEVLNYRVFSTDEVEPDQIIMTANTHSLFGNKKLIIVKNLESIGTKTLEKFIPYIKNPSPSTCLVFVADRIDVKKPFYLSFPDRSVFEFNHPKTQSQAKFQIMEMAKSLGKKLEDPAIDLLVEFIGLDLSAIFNELKKLGNFVGSRNVITDQDVLDVVVDTRTRVTFDFTDSLGEGDVSNSLIILHKLLENGESTGAILGLLGRQYRLLIQTKDLEEKKGGSGNISKKLKIHPFYLDKYIKQSGKFSFDDLKFFMSIIHTTDLAIKTTGQNNKLLMERMIFEICA